VTAKAAGLAELARHFAELARAATVGSQAMAQHNAPIKCCLEANDIANRALQLSAELEELARDAAPIAGLEQFVARGAAAQAAVDAATQAAVDKSGRKKR
jgi:hypothetical protein